MQLPPPHTPQPVPPEPLRWVLIKRTVASLIKIALLSRRRGLPLPRVADGRPALVLGNGPSVGPMLEHDADALRRAHLYVANHFAQSPHYAALQPQHYVLFDPTFFVIPPGHEAHAPAVQATLTAIRQQTTWPLHLYVQASVRQSPALAELRQALPHMQVHYINYVVAEGLPGFRHWAYKHHLGYPRSRNVLHVALYIALYARHQNIYLLGAENDYFRRIGVDDQNRLFTYVTYFYQPTPTGGVFDESQRVYPTNMGNIGDFFEMQCLTLRGYYPLQTYAQSQGQSIVNVTPGTVVDAFARQPWAEIAEALRKI